MFKRYLEKMVLQDTEEKMVFIGGPRQVGKTTLAKMAASRIQPNTYLNWDNRLHRQDILNLRWSPDSRFVIFDELHKYTKWKSFIKGIWDTHDINCRFMVTGSSRLDIFRKGGDSLLGRYHYYRLHPFSLKELSNPEGIPFEFPSSPPCLNFDMSGSHLNELIHYGGFPEPLLAGNERTLKRWQKQRFERVFREDIREVEIVRQLSQVELLGQILPDRVASPISLSSLASDIEVSPKTVKDWMELLCRNYYSFKVPPYHKKFYRALKKESKYYLWDWSEVRDPGMRFENLIATHLLKFCQFYEDAFGISAELFYLRDLEKREVDFLIVWEGEPWCAIECKLKLGGSLSHLNYFAERLKVSQRFVVTQMTGVDHQDRRTGIRSISADKFLMALI